MGRDARKPVFGISQTHLYSHRSRLEAWNFGFKKKRNGTIRVAKTKALISFAVTAKAKIRFPHDAALFWVLSGKEPDVEASENQHFARMRKQRRRPASQ